MFIKTTSIIAVALLPVFLLTGCGEEQKENPASTNITVETPSPTPTPVFTPLSPEEAKTTFFGILKNSQQKAQTEGMVAESPTFIIAYNMNYSNIDPNANVAAYYDKTKSEYGLIWEGEGLILSLVSYAIDSNPEGITVEQTNPDTYIVNLPEIDAITSLYPAQSITMTVKDNLVTQYSFTKDVNNVSIITYGSEKANEILTEANKLKGY